MGTISKNTSGQWEVVVDGNSTLLSTAGKYLDSDILAKQGPNATFDSVPANLSGTNDVDKGATTGTGNVTSSLGTKATSAPASGYYIALTAKSSASAKTQKVNCDGRGYVEEGTIASFNVTYSAGDANKYYPITTGVLSASSTVSGVAVTASSGAVTASSSSATISGKTKVTPTAVTTNTSGISGPFVAISAQAGTNSATFSSLTYASTASANVTTAGYVTSSQNTTGTTTISGTVDVGAGSAATYYIGLTAGSVSSSVSGTNPTATGKLTVSGTKANYGFTTTQPSGTDGTNYLTLTPGATSNSQTFTASMSFTKGWIESKGTEGTKTVSATTADGTKEYIPIVTPAFDGGGLSGNDISASIVAPTVEIGASGTMTGSSASNYGLTTTKPSGTDGTNYLSIDAAVSSSNGSVSGSTTITRAAVLYNGAKKGLVNIADDTQALGSTTKTVSASGTITPDVLDSFAARYVPIVTATATGGTASASASIAKQPSATATVSSTGMRTSSSATSYYFTGSASSASGYSTASATATGGSASVGKGITTGASASGTASGNKSATSTEVTASDSKTIYIPAASFTGGGLTATQDVGIVISETASGSQDTNIDIAKTDVGAKNTTDYPYYFKIQAGGTTKTVTRAAITAGESGGGYIPDSGSVLGSGSTTVTANTATTYVKMKKATLGVSGSITNVAGSATKYCGTVSMAKNDATVSGKTSLNSNTNIKITTSTSDISTYYVSLKATAAANNNQSIAVSGSATITSTVTAEGYVKTTDTGSATVSASGSATVNVGAKDSSQYYIAIPTGSASVVANSKTITLSGSPSISGTTATWSSGNQITSVSGSVGTAGWITSVSSANFTSSASHSLTVYNGETA